MPRDRRTVTVLFADVVGSTESTAKTELEAGYAKISPAVETTVAVVEHHGGTINKLLGDGVMATFGVPAMMEDHALRACRCALAIQRTLEEQRETRTVVKMRIGINSGPALITENIQGEYTSYDVHGPAVNLTSRIEAEAVPGSVYISEPTFRLVRHAFNCRTVGLRRLKGFDEPQLLYELLGQEIHQPLRGLTGYQIHAPFLGRESDLAGAVKTLDSLKNGKGGVLLIVGEAGVGKSRFLAEIRLGLPPGLQWYEGHCDTFTARISFWPFIVLLRSILGTDHWSASGNWQDLQQTTVNLLGNEAADLLPYLATLLNIAVPAPEEQRLRGLNAEVLGAQVFRATRRLFERISLRGPLVLVVEDLHWADLSSRELLHHLLPLVRTVPILFIILSRPEPESLEPLREAVPQDLRSDFFEELVLSPLSVVETQQLLVAILGDDHRLDRLRDRILYKVEGNPFFLEEVIRELIDMRVLVLDEARGTWSAKDLDIAIPQTVEGVLMARIDRLDERLRNLLGIAAVIGRTFLYRLLRAVTTGDVNIDEALAELSTNEMIEQLRSAPEIAYLFRHALTHQAVYNSLLLDKRHQLHARIARILEELYAGRLHEITSLLAFHYARAQDPERSLHYLLEAAAQSSRMAADGEALELLEEAVAAQGDAGTGGLDPVQRARVEWQLGDIHYRRGDQERAEAHLLRAIYGGPMPDGHLALNIAIIRELIQHTMNILLWLLKAPKFIATPMKLADEVRLRPYQTLGWIYVVSDHDRLKLVMLRVANLVRTFPYIEFAAKSFAGLGHGFDLAGLPRIAAHYHQRARDLAEGFNDLTASCFAKIFLGAHLFIRGQWQEAEQVYREACENADRIGDLTVWSIASVHVCDIWNETAEFSRVFELSEAMEVRGQESAFQPLQRWGLMQKGKALWRTGRTEEAVTSLNEAFRLSMAANDFISIASMSGDLALALMALGYEKQAERMLAELRQRIVAGRIRFWTIYSFYAASAELTLLQLESGEASIRDARRACADIRRFGRTFSMGRAPALRLEARLASLSRRTQRADRLWRRAANAAVALGARYELGLIEQERNSRLHARVNPA